MTHQVTLRPSGHAFRADSNEILLESALKQGIGIPYGCKSGVCGSCKGKIISGEFSHGSASEHALTVAERAQGITLLCCASAQSDLTIEIRENSGTDDYPIKTMPARIQSLTLAAPDVMVLQLKLPANEKFRFRPGQYIDILLKDGQRRSFSIANRVADNDTLELHVRKISGGQFTEQVFATMKPRDILRIEGPHGSFFLRDDSTPIILLAGGTGFAPIKSIVEYAIENKLNRPMHIYWGAQNPSGLYMHELAMQWTTQLPSLRYTPVISDCMPSSDWRGRTGLVHLALMADYRDLSKHQVYACGSPGMIDAAKSDLVKNCGLPTEAFFSDAFTFSTAPA